MTVYDNNAHAEAKAEYRKEIIHSKKKNPTQLGKKESRSKIAG